jgi:hypothetical protein
VPEAEKLVRREKFKKGKFALFLFPFFIIPIMGVIFYIAYAETLPSFYTANFGQQYSAHITVQDKNNFRISSRICPRRYTVESPQLEKTSIVNNFCIMRDDYREMPQKGVIKVSGKESLFGRTIEYYEVIREQKSDQELETLSGEWTGF